MKVDRRALLAQLSASAFAWSAFGREALGQTVTYGYDDLGRVRTVTYSNGATITYTYDDAGNRERVVQVTGSGGPYGTFSAAPTSIAPGGSAILSWTSSGATSATIDNGVGGVSPVAGGSINVSPGTTTLYTLTLTGPGGATQLQATVTVSSTFNQTIQVTGPGPVNLRSLADAAGYNGAQNATVTFVLGAGVTITGAAGSSATGGGRAIETGTWPSSSYAIALTLQVSGKVYGGGGGGGRGSGSAPASLGTVGGDAIYAQENLTVVVNAGGEVKAGGGGGGGGGGWSRQITIEGIPSWVPYNGGGGGGGFPNGSLGAAGSYSEEWFPGNTANPGSAGTTSGGGAGGAGGAAGAGRTTGAGGAGAAAGAAGVGGADSTGSESATWIKLPSSGGGQPGYAVRKNGKTVSVTNNGTIVGAQG